VMPNTLEDLWTTLMELDQHATSQKPEKQQQTDDDTNKHTTSGVYPVSRFGALLAASLIRLPEDEDHRAIDEYCLPLFTLILVSRNSRRLRSYST